MLIKALLTALCFFAAITQAEQAAFTFAPPPVTKAPAINSESQRFNLSYLNISLDSDNADDDLSGFGAAYINRNRRISSGGVFSAYGNTLTSDDDNLSLISLGVGGGLEKYSRDGSMIAGLGVTLSYSRFEIEQTGNTIDNDILIASLQISIQKRLSLGDSGFALTPYALGSISMGTVYISDLMDTIDTREDIDPLATVVFGLDADFQYFSLTGSYQTDNTSSTTMINLGFEI